MWPWNFEEASAFVNVLIFAGAAAAIWAAGTRLSAFSDIIADRTGLGQALAGLLLLAVATSLPELATTLTATLIGNAPLAVANLLGGISMQTTILVVLDALLVAGALTMRSPRPVLLLEGLLVLTLLAIVVAGMAVPASVAVFGIGLPTIALLVAFVVGTYAAHKYEGHPRWKVIDGPQPHEAQEQRREQEQQRGVHHQAPVRSLSTPGRGAEQAGMPAQDESAGKQGESVAEELAADIDESHRREQERKSRLRDRYRDVSTSRIGGYFAVGAAVILVAGWLIARVGDALAMQTGLGGTVVGFVLVAIATSLPEVSTTTAAIRFGSYSMAISNIFGSNSFDASLLFAADAAYRDGPILQSVEPWAGFATALGMLLTVFYLWGLVERRDRTIFGMGIDSALILVTYVAGLGMLYVLR